MDVGRVVEVESGVLVGGIRVGDAAVWETGVPVSVQLATHRTEKHNTMMSRKLDEDRCMGLMVFHSFSPDGSWWMSGFDGGCYKLYFTVKWQGLPLWKNERANQ